MTPCSCRERTGGPIHQSARLNLWLLRHFQPAMDLFGERAHEECPSSSRRHRGLFLPEAPALTTTPSNPMGPLPASTFAMRSPGSDAMSGWAKVPVTAFVPAFVPGTTRQHADGSSTALQSIRWLPPVLLAARSQT